MMTADLLGTTFTGNPTSTTFGNTCRMFFYTLFMIEKAKLAYAPAQFHAGDDVLLVIDKSDEQVLLKSIAKYTLRSNPTELTDFGLG